jgi:nucleoside-diphosphate-sugar epimerase
VRLFSPILLIVGLQKRFQGEAKMRVFVTGATGFVGSAVVNELIGAGHSVLGLARNDANAKKLTEAGADVHRGDLNDLKSLQSGAEKADAVAHLAFMHDWANFATRFAEICAADKAAIDAMGEVLAGSSRPIVVTAGQALRVQGRPATEQDEPAPGFPRLSEAAAMALAEKGVRASTVRLPPTTHGVGDHGFVPILINTARTKGVAAYIGDGTNKWAAGHRLDAAVVYRLALEKAAAGARYHVVDEEGVPMREIAGVIGRRLGVPVVSKTQEEAMEHFGFLGMFVGMNIETSSAWTQKELGWKPKQPGLLADIDQPAYFEHAAEYANR